MRLLRIALFLVVVVFGSVSCGYAAPVLTPYNYYEDFESGSVGAWSSYPPSQDTAYDPTIWVKPLKSEDSENRALYREITPNFEIDYVFGVRKKFDMYIDSSSVLSFKSYIKSNSEIDGVMLLFGFADGSAVERMITFGSRQTWRDCSIKLADIIPQNTIKKLDAIAFMARCPNADPENLLRFGIDDVKISGMREAQWNFSTPAVHKLDEWRDFITGSHFTEDGSITISGTPPFTAGSIAITVSRALTGEDEKFFRMRQSRTDENWSITIPLTMKSGITAGFWRATIKASSRDKKDDTISTSLVFLVKTKDAPVENPRLFMSSGETEKIRARAASGRMKNIWERLQKNAQNYRDKYDYNTFNYNLDAYDEIYWLPTYNGYVNAISIPSSYIRTNGVVYGVSGDTEAGDAARRALLKMAEWKSYVHPHILNQGQYTYWPVGQKLTDMAVGYDMVADRFTLEERKKVAQALYSKGVTEVFKEYVRDNRVSSNTSNWIGDVTGGGILCTLAVMNELPEEELEPYLTGMILKMNDLILGCFDEDGGFGEGFSYLSHAMHSMNVALPALERTFRIHFPEKLYRCLEFVLYLWDSETKAIYDFGDTSTGVGSLSSFAYIISKSRNPLYKWLYDLSPGSSDVDFFLMDDSVESKGPEDLSTVRLFRDVGTAVFRSGFGHDDFAFIFRCGPFYNHQHFDQGAFYLVDRGETFLCEVGRSDYYNDPWYQKMVIQPGGHNCILVNGNPESQRSGDLLHDVSAWGKHASVTDFATFETGAFVSGRLDPVYKGALDYLRRSVLYVKPRTVVLIDEILGAKGAKTVDIRFHAPRMEDITLNGKDASITRPGGILTIHTAVPADFTPQIMKRPLTLYEFGGENAITMKKRGFLQQSSTLDTGHERRTFVNILSTDSAIIAGLNEKMYDDHGVLSIGGSEYYINTSCGALDPKTYKEGSAETDALVYASIPGGYIAMRATRLVLNGETLFSTDKPVSLVFKDGEIMSITYSAAVDTKLSFKLSSSPKLVSLNGERYRDWKYSEKSGLSMELTAGSGVVGIR